MMMEFGIVTPEIVKVQIEGLEAAVRGFDNNIDSYLETYSMMKNSGAFREHDIKWITDLIETAQYHKQKALDEIELKKSVLQFIK
jgi:hypothetical protein